MKNTVVINTSNQKALKNELQKDKEINKLMEIKIIDSDETNADTLKQVIQKTLGNKDVFMPFEFSLNIFNGSQHAGRYDQRLHHWC